MDEAQVKAFLNITAGTTEETFASFMSAHGGDLGASVADYLEAAVDGGKLNGSDDYKAWCAGTAKDILGGKYGSLADVQSAADAFVASK